jgi:hypothetical protein
LIEWLTELRTTIGATEATFRYVLHENVECYLQAGWVIAADLSDCYHGEFGVLMLRPPTLDGPEDDS